MKKVTTDQLLLDNVNKDAKKSKIVGFLLILFAGLIQFLGVLDFNIQGFRVMVVLIGVILFWFRCFVHIGKLYGPSK